MKQRILLIVAVLLIATPAFATVNITVTQGTGDDVNKLTVRYNCTGSEAVRAFALNFALGSPGNSMIFSPGPNDINDFNRGESNQPGGGYGIFPGQFATRINPGSPDWFNLYYTPLAPTAAIDACETGLGKRTLIAELGTLYKDANAPGTSGTLFSIRVADPNAKGCDNLRVELNTIRGGVVLENGSAASTNLPTDQEICLVVCPAAPATLTYPAADGNNGRYQVSWSAAANATGYRLDRSANAGSTWTAIYTGTATTVCDDVNTGNYRYRVAATAAGCADACNTGSTDCAVVLCFPTAEPNMTTWKNLGKPRCWCYQRQCRGDGDGLVSGGTKTGYIWVTNADLTVFMKAYNKKEPTFAGGLQGEPNICYDFDHTQTGGTKTGYIRVTNADLTVFMNAYNKKEPTFGSGIGTCPAGAAGSRFTLPGDFKPCN